MAGLLKALSFCGLLCASALLVLLWSPPGHRPVSSWRRRRDGQEHSAGQTSEELQQLPNELESSGTSEFPGEHFDPAAIDLTSLVNTLINSSQSGSPQLFSLLSVTSYSSMALHKLTLLVYNISSVKNIESSRFRRRFCYCVTNQTNDLTDFTAILLDVMGNSSSFLHELFKSASIVSVSQRNNSDCIYICVMAGQLGREPPELWALDSVTPLFNQTIVEGPHTVKNTSGGPAPVPVEWTPGSANRSLMSPPVSRVHSTAHVSPSSTAEESRYAISAPRPHPPFAQPPELSTDPSSHSSTATPPHTSTAPPPYPPTTTPPHLSTAIPPHPPTATPLRQSAATPPHPPTPTLPHVPTAMPPPTTSPLLPPAATPPHLPTIMPTQLSTAPPPHPPPHLPTAILPHLPTATPPPAASTPHPPTATSQHTPAPFLPSAPSRHTAAPSLPSAPRRTAAPPLPSTPRHTAAPPLPSALSRLTAAPLPALSRLTAAPPLPSAPRRTAAPPLPSALSRHTAAPPLPSTLSRHTAAPPLPSALSRHTAAPPLPPAPSRHTAAPPLPPAPSRHTAAPPLPPAPSRHTAAPPLPTAPSRHTVAPMPVLTEKTTHGPPPGGSTLEQLSTMVPQTSSAPLLRTTTALRRTTTPPTKAVTTEPPGCPWRRPELEASAVKISARKLQPCVFELCKFYSQCLCRAPQTRRPAKRYCTDHLWYQKHTLEVCRRVRRLSFSRNLKQRCLSKMCDKL